MRYVRRISLTAGAAGMLLVGLIPPAMAATTITSGTSSGYGQIPADCSLASVGAESMSLTCTDRPSGQHWNLDIACLGAPVFFVHGFGNHVTGDGTSTATCLTGRPALPQFLTYSS
ncbi:MAG: hypothetical protein ACRDPY_31105 [Streptosporangiaceae bacterium]